MKLTNEDKNWFMKANQIKYSFYGHDWFMANRVPPQFCSICNRCTRAGCVDRDCECSVWHSVTGLSQTIKDSITKSKNINMKMTRSGNYRIRSSKEQLYSCLKRMVMTHSIRSIRKLADTECIDAWLGINETKDNKDHEDPETASKQSLRQLVAPPDLLILSAVQRKANKEGANVLLDTISIRLQSEKPTWFWERIGQEFNSSHICYNDDVNNLLDDEFEYIDMGKAPTPVLNVNNIAAKDMNQKILIEEDNNPLVIWGSGLGTGKNNRRMKPKGRFNDQIDGIVKEDIENDF